MIIRWIGRPYPKRYGRKREIGKLDPGLVAKRAHFPFETTWFVVNERGAVLMPDGGWMDCWEFYLTQFGHVMGPRDLLAAQHLPEAGAGRQAGTDRINAELLNQG